MFINDIGTGYANDNLYGAHFVYEGKVYRVQHITHSVIEVLDLADRRETTLPTSIITGWRTFKYPRLGWRKCEDVVFRVTRAARSYSRGIGPDNAIIEPSTTTLSTRFCGEFYAWEEYKEGNWTPIMHAVLAPVYDSKDKWAALIEGSINSFVPKHDLLCEKHHSGDIAITLADINIGYYSPSGKVRANKNNATIINNIVRTYAS